MPLGINVKQFYKIKCKKYFLELGINSLCCFGYEFSTDFKHENLHEGTLEYSEMSVKRRNTTRKKRINKQNNLYYTYIFIYSTGGPCACISIEYNTIEQSA